MKTLSQSAEKGVQVQLIKEIQVSCQMTKLWSKLGVFSYEIRHYDLFRDEKSVKHHIPSVKKTTNLILCNVVLAPVPIHSLYSRLKYS